MNKISIMLLFLGIYIIKNNINLYDFGVLKDIVN